MDSEFMEDTSNQDCYIPQCDEDIKPKKGRLFITLEEGINFYKEYGMTCGFDIQWASAKKSGDTVIWRYLVCSREWEKQTGIEVMGQSSQTYVKDKKKAFEAFYGVRVPEEIQVHPPNVIKTKGSESRLVSQKEKAIKMANKPKRRCDKCKEMGNHDSKNCDKFNGIDKQKK